MVLARQLDLLVLAAALPVFLVAGAPLLGYAVAAFAWLTGRALEALAVRRRRDALVEGRRNQAIGVTAASMLGRLWILAGAILVVGLIERDAGLAAAILAFALVTAHLASGLLTQITGGEQLR